MLAKLKNLISNKKEDSGFTLIEIVLVLAIAGLIFVIIFLAVSQAQQARRDTQRKNDLNRIAAQLEQFASNNAGEYPTNTEFTTGDFHTNYIDGLNFQDPTNGEDYNYTTGSPTCGSFTPPATVYYERPNSRTYTLTMCLEAGLATSTNQ